MSNESEQAPPLPPRLQMPTFARRKTRLIRNSNELDVVPPPPNFDTRPNNLQVSIIGSRGKEETLDSKKVLMNYTLQSLQPGFRTSNELSPSTNSTSQSLCSQLSISACSNNYYGTNCNYFISAGTSPVTPLPPLAHSLSFPNFPTIPANHNLLLEAQKRSLVSHRSSLQPDYRLTQMLTKVQQVFEQSGKPVVLPKRPNDDLIDLDLGDNTEGRDVLELFDPLREQQKLALARCHSADSASGDLGKPTIQLPLPSKEDDLELPTIRLPKPQEYTASSFYQSVKYKPGETPNPSIASSRSSSNSSLASTVSAAIARVQLTNNTLHVHKRPIELIAKPLNEFTQKLKRLRIAYKHEDLSTNAGFVISGRLNVQPDASCSARLRIHTPFDSQPICFTCSVNTSVEHVICHVVCTMQPDCTSFEHWALRLHNMDEYLSPVERPLGEFIYVQKCCKRRKPVTLTLLDTCSYSRFRQYARTADDDNQMRTLEASDLQIRALFNKHAEVSYDSVRILLDILDTQCNRLLRPGALVSESELDSTRFSVTGEPMEKISESAHAILKTVHQAVKALCMTLGGLETVRLTDALSNLSELYLICAQYRMNSSDAKLNATIENVHPEVMGGAITTLKKCIYELLKLYAAAYPVSFDCSLTPMEENEWLATVHTSNEENLILSSNVQDTLLVRLDSVSCLNCEWPAKYSSYFIQCDLVHGLRKLASKRSEQVPMQQGMFERIELGEYMQFDTMQICELPRETRLLCILFGVKSGAPSTPEPEAGGIYNEQHIPLAITCIFLFDDQLCMQQGEKLLGMWPEKYIEATWRPVLSGPYTERGCPLLVLSFVGGDRTIRFPLQPNELDDWNLWVGECPPAEYGTLCEAKIEKEYVSQQRSLDQLDPSTQEQIYTMLTRDPLQPLDVEEQRTLWERRHSLVTVPSALAHVLAAVASWQPSQLSELYELIHTWQPLPAMDAIQLLLPEYPDAHVRAFAVKALAKLSDDELLDLLPQLVYALRFEQSADCALGWLLQRRALGSIRVAHALYWLLKDSVCEAAAGDLRLELHLRALLLSCGNAFRSLVQAQKSLLDLLDGVCERLRVHKDGRQLNFDLMNVQQALEKRPLCLPLGVGLLVSRLQLNACTYFHSNSLPIKLVFVTGDSTENTETSEINQGPPCLYDALYKVGDDLRQDSLTMQMICIMDKLWLKEGLDLKLITFDCVSTGIRRGFIQMVKNAETLRRIQGEQGVTGSFKDTAIHAWLRKHNPSELEYAQAAFNFTYSCAGYAVATYILGIGDRHNDNIMLTRNGHLFHIDFGKFLGDAQMIGSIRRDRVPFVLSSDMAYVINGGDRPSMRFQRFIDTCCQAYNILRKHCGLFLSLCSLMLGAGISGVTPSAIRYVHDALQPALTDSRACEVFNQLIVEALSSKSTQINFFIHSLAQMRFSGELQDEQTLSFAPRLLSAQESGNRLISVRVERVERSTQGKQYFFVLQVNRQRAPQVQYVLRTYKEHCELRQKLLGIFRLAQLPTLTRPKGTTREFTKKRLPEVHTFWTALAAMASEIWHSDLIYTFLSPIERDAFTSKPSTDNTNENLMDSLTLVRENPLALDQGEWQLEALWDTQGMSQQRRTLNRNTCGLTGELKLSLVYKKNSLMVMIMHAKNLLSARYSSPDTYVKTYLLPDSGKLSKRKTRVCSRNSHPTFLEMIVYELPLEQLLKRLLYVSVWDYDSIGENLLIGAVNIELNQLDLEKDEIVSWYPLQHDDRN